MIFASSSRHVCGSDMFFRTVLLYNGYNRSVAQPGSPDKTFIFGNLALAMTDHYASLILSDVSYLSGALSVSNVPISGAERKSIASVK